MAERHPTQAAVRDIRARGDCLPMTLGEGGGSVALMRCLSGRSLGWSLEKRLVGVEV